ncbi:MAG: hypothetical protein AAF218_02640 [Pseudomonadota bacterium]
MTTLSLDPPRPSLGLMAHAPGLTRAALVLALTLIPMSVALGLDTRLVNGVNPWIKPMKFSASLTLYLLTLAWAARYWPAGFARHWATRSFHTLVLACIGAEMAWIGGAAAFGTTSHFNISSLAMGTIYGLMGAAAVTLTSAAAVHGVVIWRAHRSAFPRLVAASFVLTFVATCLTAGYMASQLSATVAGAPAGSLWRLGWSQEGGDLRVAHFWSTHAMQLVPLAFLALPRIRGTGLALLALYTALIIGTFWQAVQGVPFLPMIG